MRFRGAEERSKPSKRSAKGFTWVEPMRCKPIIHFKDIPANGGENACKYKSRVDHLCPHPHVTPSPNVWAHYRGHAYPRRECDNDGSTRPSQRQATLVEIDGEERCVARCARGISTVSLDRSSDGYDTGPFHQEGRSIVTVGALILKRTHRFDPRWVGPPARWFVVRPLDLDHGWVTLDMGMVPPPVPSSLQQRVATAIERQKCMEIPASNCATTQAHTHKPGGGLAIKRCPTTHQPVNA